MVEIKKVMVVGAGTMGTSIAQVMASRGLKVYLVDQNEELLERSRKMLTANVETMLSEGLYQPGEKQLVESGIEFVLEADIQAVAGEVDLAVESVFEKPEIKQAVFFKLDKFCRPDCILCSNTSASNVFEFVKVSHGERFLITHWFNPAYLMQLVEVVCGPETSEKTVDAVVAFLRSLGKKPCVLKQYVPGFIVNRLANTLCREVGYMVSQGWTTAQEIDEAIKATSGVRYAFEGPMALNDVVGWDLITTGCDDMYKSLCSSTETSEYYNALVRDNKLGVKTGEGVYDYSDTTAQEFLTERAKKIIKMYKFIQTL